MARRYAQLATELRTRSAGVEVDATTRMDGYSEDIDYQESSTTSNRRGRVPSGWFDPDLPY